MPKFGEISWNDEFVDGEKKNNNNSKDQFLKLDSGPNELRIITQPYQYLVHKYKKAGDPGFGRKVPCSALNGSCPLCETGDKAKPRWYLGVISRKDNTYKILDISIAVFGQIRKYAKNTQRFGDPTKYDINIEVDKNGGAQGYYTVQAFSKEALSAHDQSLKDAADLDSLKRLVSPPTAETVLKIMARIDGDAPPAANTKTATKNASPVVPAVNMTDDEELEKLFPDHDAT